MGAMPAQHQGRAVWTRVSPTEGQVLDLLHARVVEPYAPFKTVHRGIGDAGHRARLAGPAGLMSRLLRNAGWR